MNSKNIPLTSSNILYEDDERKIAEYGVRLEKSNLVEDIKFREIAKSKEAIQEILRVILEDDSLIILRNIGQKEMSESIFHGVILDCECRLSTGELVDIEMQIDNKNAPVKRVRYNQSAMTIAHSPKDKHFDYNKIPTIITIMICEFDIFKMHNPIYEIKRKINNTNVVAENGIREIYVNLKAKAKDYKMEELFSILTKINYTNEQLFPNLTKTKIKYEKLRNGGKVMSGLTREIYLDGYASGEKRGEIKGKIEGELKAFVNMLRQGLISEDVVLDNLKITKEELESKIKEYSI